MNQENQPFFGSHFEFDQGPQQRREKSFPLSVVLMIVSIATAAAILLTYTVTTMIDRRQYLQKLEEQQAVIDRLQNGASGLDVEQLDVLAALFEQYSYYAGQVSQEELLTAVMKAYAEATGDRYAEYYTEEEYAEMMAENVGNHVGIGISVVRTTVQTEGVEYAVFQVIDIYRNAPAASSELQIGDMIYAVKIDGAVQTVSSLGYTKTLNAFRGEAGTAVEFSALRPIENGYAVHQFSITRGTYESESVTYQVAEQDPTIGIVQISNFDFTTPKQLKAAVNALEDASVEHFVFDVRNNPGGDLQSIRACLTYFLQKGDLILRSIDRNGNTVKSYTAEAMTFIGDYAACNVSAAEIGMFADLDMVVLCNENTASAAEVFTATLYDHGLAHVVGEKTFGKGIMQTYIALSRFGDYQGYAKMTTYAYVTERGVTYHEVGIEPHERVALSEEAKSYHFYLLPQEKDDQLQAAIAYFE